MFNIQYIQTMRSELKGDEPEKWLVFIDSHLFVYL